LASRVHCVVPADEGEQEAAGDEIGLEEEDGVESNADSSELPGKGFQGAMMTSSSMLKGS
jgi:hypothetical protein